MQYRYLLKREWDSSKPRINWIMLNPSTADEEKDDPTIRKCIGFSKRWGFGSLSVTNLFAGRSTDPKDLKKLLDSGTYVEEGNNLGEIAQAARCAQMTVVAWGAHKFARKQARYVLEALKGIDIYAIGETMEGYPKHPVMAKYTDYPILYKPRVVL